MSDRRRLREIGATILLVIGGIGLVTASTGWWLERNFLHTSRFTDTANELLDQDEVQAELASVLVRQLSRRAGTNLQVAEPFLATIVGQVVETSAFRTVFDLALSNAHRVLVDRETGTIILNLTSAYDQIKQPLQQVAPNLARELPSRNQLEFVLLHRSQLTTVWDAIDRAKRIVGFLTIGGRAAAGRGRGAGGGPLARASRAVHGSSRAREWCSSSRSSAHGSCSGRASPTGCWPTRWSRRSASSRRRSSCSRRSSS